MVVPSRGSLVVSGVRRRLAESQPCSCQSRHSLRCPHAAFKVQDGILMHYPGFVASRRGNVFSKHAIELGAQIVIPATLDM